MRHWILSLLCLPVMLNAATDISKARERADALMASITSHATLEVDTTIKNPYVGARHTPAYVAKKSRPEPPEFTLRGILNTKALIGGTTYTVGDTIDGFLLQTVTEKGITVTKAGRTYTLMLHQASPTILIERDEP